MNELILINLKLKSLQTVLKRSVYKNHHFTTDCINAELLFCFVDSYSENKRISYIDTDEIPGFFK